MRWNAVVPVKRLTTAKTRLSTARGAERRELALAFARDTVAALLEADCIDSVLVVTDDRAAAEVLRGQHAAVIGEPSGGGLNAAFGHGAAHLRQEDPHTSILAVCADLPALRPAEVTDALAMAAAYERAFVADHVGTGTTMLIAAPGAELDPRFGASSADAHRRSGAVPVVGRLPSVRQDVDSVSDLDAAVVIGVGRWTAQALGLG